MNSFRDKKSILVLDNAAVHLKYAIYLKCSIVGVKVLFLPQYSYDLNPIKPVHHLAKSYIRKKWGNRNANHPFNYMLEEAFRNCLIKGNKLLLINKFFFFNYKLFQHTTIMRKN
jgi:hypothetical protein